MTLKSTYVYWNVSQLPLPRDQVCGSGDEQACPRGLQHWAGQRGDAQGTVGQAAGGGPDWPVAAEIGSNELAWTFKNNYFHNPTSIQRFYESQSIPYLSTNNISLWNWCFTLSNAKIQTRLRFPSEWSLVPNQFLSVQLGINGTFFNKYWNKENIRHINKLIQICILRDLANSRTLISLKCLWTSR